MGKLGSSPISGHRCASWWEPYVVGPQQFSTLLTVLIPWFIAFPFSFPPFLLDVVFITVNLLPKGWTGYSYTDMPHKTTLGVKPMPM